MFHQFHRLGWLDLFHIVERSKLTKELNLSGLNLGGYQWKNRWEPKKDTGSSQYQNNYCIVSLSGLGVRRAKAALFQWVKVPPG